MNSPETTTLLKKHIRTVLNGVGFPPPAMPRLDELVVERAIDRIGADERLAGLFAGIDDDSLRRTFLSVYYRTLNAST